jgi:putative ABC transport system substrate-binding protein
MLPTIGFLNAASADAYRHRLRGFHRGLKEMGFVEGQNVAVEYRWAENRVRQLPVLATELVQRRVSLIVTGTSFATTFAASKATKTIPIVFVCSGDPVGLGFVTSLARPTGNLTGVNFFNLELLAKRLAILRDIVPTATRVAALIDVTTGKPEEMVSDVEQAARKMTLKVSIFRAATTRDIDAAFASMANDKPDILFVSGGPLFNARRVQLAMLAMRYGIIAGYASHDYADAGGLMSYGSDVTDAFRQAGVYAGRILKGEKLGNLPVLQATKFELVINLKTAKALGLEFHPQLLATADAVIE